MGNQVFKTTEFTMNNYFKYFQYMTPKCLYYKPIENSIVEYKVEINQNKWIVDTTSSVWKAYMVVGKNLKTKVGKYI